MLQLISLGVYHVINIVYDVKFRKTKNLWHLTFFVLGTIFYVFDKGSLLNYFLLILLSLIFGLLLETFKLTSPGDTKMCIVTTVWLGSFVDQSPVITVIGLYVFFQMIVQIISYIALIKKFGFKWLIKNQLYNLTILMNKDIKMPLTKEKALNRIAGAVPIAIGTFLNAIYMTL